MNLMNLNKKGRYICFAECERPVMCKDNILGFGDTPSEAIRNAEDNLQDGSHNLELDTELTNTAIERLYDSQTEPKA